jgi:hypothetical protein
MIPCPKCGEPLDVARPGPATHTVAGRGDRWQGTLVELLTCNPAPTEEDPAS